MIKFFIVPLLILSPVRSWTASPAQTPPKETYKELIAIAQNLSIQRDRIQATQTLIRGLNKEKSLIARKEILKSLKELSEYFYTEKAQQLFELGESLRHTTPLEAVDRYLEALKIEPGQVAVIRSLARSYLASGSCEKVIETAKLGLDLNPYSDELNLLHVQAQACLGRTKETRSSLEKIDYKKSPLRMYFDLVRIQCLYLEEKTLQAEEELKKIIESEPGFPESYYWMAQIKQKQKVGAQEWNKRYVKFCEGDLAKLKRKFDHEPRLCQEKKNVEAELEAARSGGTA